LEAFASSFVPSMATAPTRSSPASRASSSTRRNAASNAARFDRRKAAIVSWSGCRLAAT
jgi:hypothetical protein